MTELSINPKQLPNTHLHLKLFIFYTVFLKHSSVRFFKTTGRKHLNTGSGSHEAIKTHSKYTTNK